MTEQERQLIQGLATRIQNAPPPQIDREADELIRRSITRPDALYLLVQTVLIQDMALNQAKAQIDDLKQRASASPGSGFGIFTKRTQRAARPVRRLGARYPRSAARRLHRLSTRAAAINPRLRRLPPAAEWVAFFAAPQPRPRASSPAKRLSRLSRPSSATTAVTEEAAASCRERQSPPAPKRSSTITMRRRPRL